MGVQLSKLSKLVTDLCISLYVVILPREKNSDIFHIARHLFSSNCYLFSLRYL